MTTFSSTSTTDCATRKCSSDARSYLLSRGATARSSLATDAAASAVSTGTTTACDVSGLRSSPQPSEARRSAAARDGSRTDMVMDCAAPEAVTTHSEKGQLTLWHVIDTYGTARRPSHTVVSFSQTHKTRPDGRDACMPQSCRITAHARFDRASQHIEHDADRSTRERPRGTRSPVSSQPMGEKLILRGISFPAGGIDASRKRGGAHSLVRACPSLKMSLGARK